MHFYFCLYILVKVKNHWKEKSDKYKLKILTKPSYFFNILQIKSEIINLLFFWSVVLFLIENVLADKGRLKKPQIEK